MLGLSMDMMPEVVDSASDRFGSTDPAVFDGTSIPIRAVMGDQSASTYGLQCVQFETVADLLLRLVYVLGL